MPIIARIALGCVALVAAACSSFVEQGDANQVSIANSEFDTYAGLQRKAAEHCGQYGKQAVLQGRFDA